MLAIQTKFIGPTNHRGSRYSAWVMEKNPRRLTLGADDALGLHENHRAAAVTLIDKLGWTAAHGYGPWIEGDCETGYVYACDTKYGIDKIVV